MRPNKEPEVIIEGSQFDSEEVTPKDLLKFAKWILMVIAGLFVLGMGCQLFGHDKAIFEACKTILPAIATLVIGFYFGKSH